MFERQKIDPIKNDCNAYSEIVQSLRQSSAIFSKLNSDYAKGRTLTATTNGHST